MKRDDDTMKLAASAWKERVYIETQEYVIRGDVFMPKIGNRSRFLSEILNTNKQFMAVTDCTLESKLFPQKEVERQKFIQVNISSILIMRPLNND